EELMRLLVANGANPKATTPDGANALIYSAGLAWRDGKTHGTEKESIEAIKYELELGLDVNATTSKTGETALHGAAGRGADTIVQFLADHGAKLDIEDSQGRTALDTANGVGASLGGVRSPHDSTAALLAKLGGHAGHPKPTPALGPPPAAAAQSV